MSTIAWASNAAVEMAPFYAGRVHSGFYGSLIAMWPTLAKLLRRALDGQDLCSALEEMNEQDSAKETEVLRAPPEAAPPPRNGKPTSLYITGHSLGGALSVLAAAFLFVGEGTLVENGSVRDLSAYQELLRGVYTYGQPMVGDAFFTKAYDPFFGSKLFRMIYKHDFVTRLPTSPMGPYEHFGVEYHATDDGWVLSPELQNTWSLVLSYLQTVLYWELAALTQIFPPVRWLGALGLLSFDEHLPIRYLRTSLKKSPYAALEIDYRASIHDFPRR